MRAACASLPLVVLAACGFGVPLKKSVLVPQQAERSATILPGESTRAEVRAALGEPWLESGFWRVEVYRSDDKRTELAFAMAIVIPVPVGVMREKQHGYVLVTYDAAGRVSRVTPGIASDGSLARASDRWMAIRADGITFAVEPVGTKLRSTLLADSSRLPDYLAERRRADGCTLVTACDEGQGCPDQVAVDDGEPFDPRPVTVLCAPDAPCPSGARQSGGEIDGKSVILVPVVRAIHATPGRHAVRVGSSVLQGGGEATFECGGGDVLYGIVRSSVEGASWRSKGRLQATVTVSAVAPKAWDDCSVALSRDGRWLVSAGPGPN